MANLVNPAYYFPMTSGAYPAQIPMGFAGTNKGVVWTKTGVNDAAQAANVWTVTTVVTSSATLQSFDIYPDASPGSKVTISAYGGSTATISATNLKNALTTNPTAFGLVSVSQASGVLTLTCRSVGIDFTVDNASNVTPAEGTTAASAQRIAPGLALMRTGFDEGFSLEKVRKVATSAFTAQSVAIAVASMSAGRLRIVVEFAGVTYTSTVAYNASNDTTVSDLATALETIFNTGALAGNSIGWSAASGTLTGTVDDAGAVFTAVIDISGATGATQTTTWTGTPDDPTYSAPAAFAGLSMLDGSQTESSPGANDSAAAANARLPVACGGPGSTFVSVASIPTAGAGVWVDGSSSDPGKIYFAGSASSSRVPLWHPYRGWAAVASGENDTTNLLAGVRVCYAI